MKDSVGLAALKRITRFLALMLLAQITTSFGIIERQNICQQDSAIVCPAAEAC